MKRIFVEDAFIFFVGGMFYNNVRNRRGDEGDEMVGRKGRRFLNDGHQNNLN